MRKRYTEKYIHAKGDSFIFYTVRLIRRKIAVKIAIPRDKNTWGYAEK